MLDHLIQFFTQYGTLAVFGALILCGFGMPIPEDIVLVAGGVLAGIACRTDFSFLHAFKDCNAVHIMFGVSMAGVLIGDACMYLIGRIFGEKLLNMRFTKKLLPPERVRWVQKKFRRYGVYFIFVARFMPGLRSPIFIITGITRRVSFIKFFLTDGSAALISVPFWVYLGFWGERQLSDVEALEKYIKQGQISLLVVLSVVVVVTVVVLYIKNKLKHKIKILDDDEDNTDGQ